MGDNRTGCLVRIVSVLLPLAIVLVVVELVVRFAGLESPNHRIVYADTVVKGRPNASYVNRKENRTLVRLNNEGFHDRDWDESGDEYGFLFLGDSMVEGIQVEVDSLFTSLLEDAFVDDGVRIDVFNAAVSATGTGHQYLLWKTFVPDSGIRVDHVVLCLFPQNDLKNNHVDIGRGPENYGVYLDQDGTPYVHRPGRSGLRSSLRKATNYSALLNLVYTRLHYLRGGTGPGAAEEPGAVVTGTDASATASGSGASRDGLEPDARSLSHPDFAAAGAESLWAESLRRTLLLIGRWNVEARDAGLAFSVVLIPGTDRHNFYELELSRRLVEAGQTGEMRVLRLELDGRAPVETNSFDGAALGHLNYLGHRLAAEELHEWFGEFLCTHVGGEGT